MEPLNGSVRTLDGQILSLNKDLEEIVQALARDGCLILESATNISTVEQILALNEQSKDIERRHRYK